MTLLQFGAFLLYDTQKVIHKAEHHPAHYGAPPFDPVNASIGIYMDTVSIFLRFAMMLAEGGNRRKEEKKEKEEKGEKEEKENEKKKRKRMRKK